MPLVLLALFGCAGAADDDDGAAAGSGGAAGDGGNGGSSGSALVAASTSFGECVGHCVFEVALGHDPWSESEYERVSYIVRGRIDGPVLVEKGGVLTASGRERGRASAEALASAELDPIYGCPDCADGGASQVTLLRRGALSTHTYEHGRPPAILESVDAFASGIWVALRTCVSSEHLSVDEECTPDE